MGGTTAQPSSNAIRDLRMARGLTQEELAARLGDDTSIATVSRLESGRMTLTLPWMRRISSALGVSPHEIIAQPGTGLRMVPVIGVIAAGAWMEAVEQPLAWLPVPDTIGGPRCFALRPEGDSMDQIADAQSYIIVDPEQNALQHNRIYAIRNEHGEATFKRFRNDPPRFEPMSNNPEHRAIAIGMEPFTVIGRVTYVGREL